MKTEFRNSLTKKTSSLQKRLTQRVRKDAVSAGWPASVAATLSVKVNGANLVVNYPDALADTVEDLEYGTPDEGPRPVMRKFVEKHVDFMADEVAEWSVDYLFDSEILP